MKTYIKRQKIIKVGNSYAVTLDSKFGDLLRDRDASHVSVAYNVDNQTAGIAVEDSSLETMMVREPVSKAWVSARVTDEFQDWVDKSLKQDKEAMERLKDL